MLNLTQNGDIAYNCFKSLWKWHYVVIIPSFYLIFLSKSLLKIVILAVATENLVQNFLTLSIYSLTTLVVIKYQAIYQLKVYQKYFKRWLYTSCSAFGLASVLIWIKVVIILLLRILIYIKNFVSVFYYSILNYLRKIKKTIILYYYWLADEMLDQLIAWHSTAAQRVLEQK